MFLNKNEIQNFRSKISKENDVNRKIEESIFKTISNNSPTSDGLESTSKRQIQPKKDTLKTTPLSAQKIARSNVIIPTHFVSKTNLKQLEERKKSYFTKFKYDTVSNSTYRYKAPRFLDLIGMVLFLLMIVNLYFL